MLCGVVRRWRRAGLRRTRWGRAAWLAVGASVAFGCAEAHVDALAVWRDQPAAPDGSLRIQIYDSGQRRTQRLKPMQAGAEPTAIELLVAPGGRGYVISTALGGTVWVDVMSGARGRIAADIWGELAFDIGFARSGLAVVRHLADDEGVLLLPTTSPLLQPGLVDVPPPLHPERPQPLRFASDAAVVFAAEIDNTGPVMADSTRPDGVISAWRFAAGDNDVPEGTLIPLARGTLSAAVTISSAFPRRVGKGWCVDGLCIAPDGDAAIAKSPLTSCQLRVFAPEQAGSDGLAPVLEVALPPACPGTDPHLVAAIAGDLVVLDDDASVYLADLTRRTWSALPKLGPGAPQLLPIVRGRGILLVSSDGSVSRIDADGMRVVSSEHVQCAVLDRPIASPEGGWVVQTCLGLPDVISEMTPDFGSVIRVSALGVERFDGIPMRTLAVDDAGNVLLYSFDPKDKEQAPRGLFVLDGDGRMTRVDELEPAVARFSMADTAPYFSARPRF